MHRHQYLLMSMSVVECSGNSVRNTPAVVNFKLHYSAQSAKRPQQSRPFDPVQSFRSDETREVPDTAARSYYVQKISAEFVST